MVTFAVGLDLSITATGICRSDGITLTVKPVGSGDRRLLTIENAVDRAINLPSGLVAIEDLPTHAKAAGITGMVHGVIRTHLIRHSIPYVLITPASLKKYATGKGNAGKPEMAVAAFKRAGVEFGDDNQCDAWWLRAMALDHLGSPICAMPAVNRAALDGVRWPTTSEES